MPKKKRPSETPDEQFERFVETARTLDIPDDEDPLTEAFSRLKSTALHELPQPPKPDKPQ
jgi:hypothetical protein